MKPPPPSRPPQPRPGVYYETGGFVQSVPDRPRPCRNPQVIVCEITTVRVLDEDMPPLAQDETALARIDAHAPEKRYPLLNRDKSTAPIWRLLLHLARVLVWRVRYRRYNP